MVRCRVWPGRIGVWPGVGFVARVGGVWPSVSRMAYGGVDKSGVGFWLSFRLPLAQVMVRCCVWQGGIGVWPGVGFVARVGGVWPGVSCMAYRGVDKSGVGFRLSFRLPLAQVMVRCSVWQGGIGVWPGVGFVAGVGGVWPGVSRMAYGGVEKSGVGFWLGLSITLPQVMVRCSVWPGGIGVWPGVGFVARVGGIWHRVSTPRRVPC